MSRGDTRLVAAIGTRKAKLEEGTTGWRGSTKKVESDGKRGQETIRLRVGANSLTFLNAPEYGKDFREEMSVPTALLGSGSQKTALLWEEFSFPSRRLSSRLFFFYLFLLEEEGERSLPIRKIRASYSRDSCICFPLCIIFPPGARNGFPPYQSPLFPFYSFSSGVARSPSTRRPSKTISWNIGLNTCALDKLINR